MICPKCGHQRTQNDDPAIPDYRCPACEIVYHKYGKPVAQPSHNRAETAGEETRNTKELRELEYARIAREVGDDRFFTRKELDHLPKILMAGEKVLSFSSGLMDGNTWLIALTDKRILFIDKGLIFGVKQASIDLDKINTVEGKTGIILGSIVIQDGAASRIIKNVPKSTVIPFTNKVRDAIEMRKKGHHQQPNLDPVERLEKLAALFEKGLLTKVEFEQQKAALLRSSLRN